MKKVDKNPVLSGIMGLCVGDALGVPVEFISRESLKKKPVTDMCGYGTYHRPAGTWSDDTSMTLCLAESLARSNQTNSGGMIEGPDYADIMTNFLKWYKEAEFTPHGEVFDVGTSTAAALERFSCGTAPLECGGTSERDNGNGSLMRILPLVFYLQSIYGTEFCEPVFKKQMEDAFTIIHNVSALTHAHKRSKIACGIYLSVASKLLEAMELKTAVGMGIYQAVKYYREQREYKDELAYFERLRKDDFANLDEKMIKSSGYVVDTLEAALWCLLNTDNYRDCVLKAVNLGEDTDTVAAVAGGLAGLYYGYESIPSEWLTAIAKQGYIEVLCNNLFASCNRRSISKICNYIPYFKTATKDSVCEFSPYPVYKQEFLDFIQAVYQTNLISFNYMEIIEQYGLDSTSEMVRAIDSADFELLKAILTGYIRQERFCDGLWADAVGDKVFLNILKRMQLF